MECSELSDLILLPLIVVSGIPYGKVIPGAVAEVAGQTITLTCYSLTIPQWSRPIWSQRLLRGEVLNNKLIITNAKTSDAGNYTCTGTSPGPFTFEVEAYVEIVLSRFNYLKFSVIHLLSLLLPPQLTSYQCFALLVCKFIKQQKCTL